MDYIISQIEAEETHAVRHPVLRKGRPKESCVFLGDDYKTTIHFGVFANKKLIGVCSLLKNNHPLIPDGHQFQLRGMAILKNFQGMGLGQLLLKHAESGLKKTPITSLWCNARETAVDFYKKCGFKIIGQPFHIESIGTHYAMYKNLLHESSDFHTK